MTRTRTSFLGPLSALLVVGMVPIAVACNGKVVSLGDTGDTLQPVTTGTAASEATGTTSNGASGAIACPAGWAHPNICCTATQESSTCGAWEDNPFRACESGATTYPNQLSCCQLSDPTNCIDSGSPPPPTLPPAYGCGFACPPGWWAQAAGAITPDGPEGPMCCSPYDGTGTQCVPMGVTVEPVAVSCASGGAVVGTNGSGPLTVDAGPSPPTDASVPVYDAGPVPVTDDAGILPGGWIDDGGCYGEDAGSPYPPGFDGGTASLCPACPPGWSSNANQPELCCQSVGGGLTLCFSQAVGSATTVTEADDGGTTFVSPPSSGSGSGGSTSPGSTGWGTAGASTEDGGVAGPSCTGLETSCSCDQTVNGTSYALDCYTNANGTVSCSCSINGTATTATPSVDSCEDSTAVVNAFSAAGGCAFP